YSSRTSTLSFYLISTASPLYPHSFPTRRSSDLQRWSSASSPHLPSGGGGGQPAGRVLGPAAGLRPRPDSYGCRASVASGTLTSRDRKSTRLNSSHLVISYAVFCLKKKKLN